MAVREVAGQPPRPGCRPRAPAHRANGSVRTHTLRLAEGHVSVAEAADLQRIVREHGCTRIAEFGLNAGHSALALLLACPQALVTSFDTCEHPYARYAAMSLRRRIRFWGRHELIVGRSQDMVPRYAQKHPERRFDAVLIDGDHYGDGPWDDTLAALLLAVPGGLIIMDDVVGASGGQAWCEAPTRAWAKAVEQGLVREVCRFTYPPDEPVGPIRGFAVGVVQLSS